jgi:hypothetical protein
MALTHCTDIDLPAHMKPRDFDHAAIHRASCTPLCTPNLATTRGRT